MFDLSLSCSDVPPTAFLGIFDFSIAPALLYYAYIPIILVSIIFGVSVLVKDRYSLKSKLFLFLAIVFATLLLNEVVQWIAGPVKIVQFSWQLVSILRMLVAILVIYFSYVFINEKDLPLSQKIILAVFLFPVIALTPTTLNISAFDIVNCEGISSYLWYFVNVFGVFSASWVAVMAFKATSIKRNNNKQQILYFSVGAIMFLLAFFGASTFGDVLDILKIHNNIALVGPVGMFLFLGLLAYLIVKFKTFNIKLLGAQALTMTIWVLVGTLFFLSQGKANHVVTGVTFAFAVILGIKLMQSVKKEVEQREQIQKQAIELAAANEKLKGLDKLKSEFLSLASHQLRSPLTAIKGYTSMMLEGSFGKIEENQREVISRVFESAQSLINMVEDFLSVSKIEQGGMQYAFTPTDLSKLVDTLYGEMKITAENKHLEFTLEMDKKDSLMVNADGGKLKQVLLNLVDNSIKYTPNGFVHLALVRDKAKNMVTFSVKDSGVGISPETKEKLFNKFSRGEGGKLNTGGSGLGLYLAREITRAHKGEIIIDSEGLGKGSTFAVTLPALAA